MAGTSPEQFDAAYWRSVAQGDVGLGVGAAVFDLQQRVDQAAGDVLALTDGLQELLAQYREEPQLMAPLNLKEVA